MNIQRLSRFPETFFEEQDIESTLKSDIVEEVCFFVLGPEGTNIGLSAKIWSKKVGISKKSSFIFCETPEEAVERSKNISCDKTFPIFVTCAVYYDMNKIFFSNPDCYTLMHHHYMKLDDMQLVSTINVENIPDHWVIASHPSPSVLLSRITNRIHLANSNSAAAKLCAEGIVDACITTESSRKIYNLKTLHNFGSPTMLFLYGTSDKGIRLLRKNNGKE